MKSLLVGLLLGVCAIAQEPYVDWDYINVANKKALEAFVQDHLAHPKFMEMKDQGCIHSWGAGALGYNCTGYGIVMWVFQETMRHNYEPGYKWLSQHIKHVIDFGYDWNQHLPGGEGVIGHPIWEGTNNRDSDRLRHAHLTPYAYIFRTLKSDPALRAKFDVSDIELELLHDMVVDWADNWYLTVDWWKSRDTGRLFQYGRGAIPARGLIETYYMTGNPKYLMAAQYIFVATFLGLDRRLLDGFVSYDTGYEDEERTSKLLYFAAHFNMEPWQLSYWAEPMAHLYVHTFDPMVKALVLSVTQHITDWVVRPDIPYGDLLKQNDGELRLSLVHGGSLTDILSGQLSPLELLRMAPDKEFYPYLVLRAHYWDGGYWNEKLPNDKDRIHYPRGNGGRPVGPAPDHAILHSWSDWLLNRFLMSGNQEHFWWALAIYRDSKYFANRSSPMDMRSLNDRDKLHYGTGNIGKSRAFAWWSRGGMHSRHFLEFMDKGR